MGAFIILPLRTSRQQVRSSSRDATGTSPLGDPLLNRTPLQMRIRNTSGQLQFESVLLLDAWLVPLVFVIFMVFGVCGNSIVLYVILKRRKMRTATNVYIASLALTDIIFLVCCVPFTAALYAWPSWVFGNFMCKLVSYIQQVSAQATCITLTVMSVDRWYVTVYPIRSLQYRTPVVAATVSLGIWIGSFLLSAPVPLYSRTVVEEQHGSQVICAELFPTALHKRFFILYNFLAVYLLPLVTISLCYLLMLHQMGRPTVEPLDNQQLQVLTERSKAFRARVSRMVVVMVLLFLLCWGPVQLFILVRAFSPHFRISYCTYKLKIWAHCMSYLNSCVNPVVYAFMGAHFRKAFRRTFPCVFKQRVGAAAETAAAAAATTAADMGPQSNRSAATHTEMQCVS
ncbi:G-protein coupled receptor 54-like [Engraulis encrasicolus]|uniref:G-protein coupled receptor 54-like n=1 Tax=Engraulis encrasicolus TaxID=184585 RepID=UPI002FD6651D